MKTRFLKIVSGMVLATMLALTVAPVSVLTQNAQHTQRIEGVWDSSVTIRQCDTGDPITTVRDMSMFIHGGTLTETANSFLRGSSLGTWRHLGGQSYTAVFRFFRFNADGSFAGRTKVTRNIELSEDADEFTATASGEVFNAADELIFTFCATETATRLE